MTEVQTEKMLFSNPFGEVTDKRVIYYRKKGWFSGGSREDIPLKHVTSIRIETSRNIFVGIILILVGLALLIYVIGILPLALGIILVWGSPNVVVTTASGDFEPMKGFPWDLKSAEAFVKALRSQLFKE